MFVAFRDGIDALVANSVPLLKQKIVAGLTSATPMLLNWGAAQFGFDSIGTRIKNAIGFLPKKVDEALLKIIRKVATKVKSGFKNDIYAGRFTPATMGNFTYTKTGEQYVIWAAFEEKSQKVKIKLAQKTAQGDKYLGELQESHFNQNISTSRSDFTILKGKALEFYNTTQTKRQAANNPNLPRPGTVKTRAAELKTLQNQLNAAFQETIADMNRDACEAVNGACFAAGTKLEIPGGFKKIEDFQVGDLILSRDQYDPSAPIEIKTVEAIFKRSAPILELHVAGQIIRTTYEHPFFVQDRGWLPTSALKYGDVIRTDSGWTKVEKLNETDQFEIVYNVRVSDHHTYFVGAEGWNWSIWAHNQACDLATLLLNYGLDDEVMSNHPSGSSLARVTQGIVRVALADTPTAELAAERIAKSLQKRLLTAGITRIHHKLSDLIEAALKGRFSFREAAEAAGLIRMTALRLTAPTVTVSPREFLLRLKNNQGASTTDHMLGWVRSNNGHAHVSGGHTEYYQTVQPIAGATPVSGSRDNGPYKIQVEVKDRDNNMGQGNTQFFPKNNSAGGESSMWPKDWSLSRIVAETYYAMYFSPISKPNPLQTNYVGSATNGMLIHFRIGGLPNNTSATDAIVHTSRYLYTMFPVI